MKALLIALALLALYAVPVAAQEGSISITIYCGAPEWVTVRNDTDKALVLQSLNSSEGRTSDVEIDLGNTEVAAGASARIDFGDTAGGGHTFSDTPGGGNIFNDDLEETATVMISGEEYRLVCDNGSIVTETFPIGWPPVQATEEEPPTVVPTPAPTGQVPGGMGKSGAGGLAPGASVPWGSLGLAASGLLAAGYAVLRRR